MPTKKYVVKSPAKKPAPVIETPPYIPERTMTEPIIEDKACAKCHCKWHCCLLALAVLLFPFIAAPWTLSIHEFPKQIFLAVIVGIGIVAMMAKAFKSGQVNLLPKHVSTIFGVLAIIVMLISALRSGVAYHGLLGFAGTESFSLLTFALISLWMILMFSSNKCQNTGLINKTIVIAGNVLSLATILSLFGFNIYSFVPTPGFNPAGTTTIAGIIAGLSIILSMNFWFGAKTKKSNILSIASLVIPALLVIGTGFRAPLIITGIGLIATLILHSMNKEKHMKAGIALAVTLITILLAIYPFATFLQTPLEVGPSHGETFSIVKSALSEHPIVGSGPGSFNIDYLKYRSLQILQTPFWNIGFDWGSSAGLTLFATLGILGGVLVFLAILSILITYGRKLISEPSLNIGTFAIGVSLFASLWIAPAPIAIQFIFATILGLMLAQSSKSISLKQSNGLGISLTGSLMIILVLGLFILQGKRVAAEIFVTRGLLSSDKTEQSQLIGKAASIDSRNDGYLRLLSSLQRQALNERLQSDPTNQDQQAALQQIRDLAGLTLGSARLATEIAGENSANWVVLGNAYLDISPVTDGAGKAAVDAFEKARTLSPSDPSILVSLSIAKKSAGEESGDLLRQATEIRPSFALAHLELARLLGSQDKFDEAMASYNKALRLAPSDSALRYEIGLFLMQKEKYAEAQAQFESAVALTPNFSNARWFLAQAYEKQNDVVRAIEQINKVIELNPENQQAKDRLAELGKIKK